MRDKEEILRDYRRAWWTRIQIILQLIILIAVAILILAGCTIIKYGEVEYASLGGKSFDKLRIVKEPNSITIEVINFKKEGPMLVVEVPGLKVKSGGGQ